VGLVGLGEINEGKLQLCDGLALAERPAFPQQANKGIDLVLLGTVAKGIKRDPLRTLHEVVESGGRHGHRIPPQRVHGLRMLPLRKMLKRCLQQLARALW
jgi:hypothetical protein